MLMARAPVSGISLTRVDAALVKGMLHRGDRQHDIASWFGVNGGRIAEISSRVKFADVLMQNDRLPPAGPYLTGKQAHYAKIALNKLMKEFETIETSKLNKDASTQIKEAIENLSQVLSHL